MKRESWLTPYVSSYLGRFLLIVLLGGLTVFSASSLMYTSGFLISKASIPPENILLIYVPIVGVRAFGTSRAVIHYVERLVSHDTILRVLSRMRVRLYRILEPQALLLSSRFRTGDILGMLADDIEYLQNVYLRTVFPSIIALLLYAASVIAIGTFDIRFAVVVGLYILVLVAVLPLVSLLLTHRRQESVKQQRNALYQKLTDAVLGMGDWVISGRQSRFVETYEADERTVARADAALRRWARLRLFLAHAVVGIAVVSMLMWSGGEFADGNIPGTLIAAFVLVVFPAADAFLPVSDAVEKIPQYRNSLRRLESIETAEADGEESNKAGTKREQGSERFEGTERSEGTERPGGTERSERSGGTEQSERVGRVVEKASARGSEGARRTEGAGETEPAADTGDTAAANATRIESAPISLQRLSYRYDAGGEWALRDLSLEVPQGRRIAVLGRSGAGKSTLLKLIQGALRPVEGRALIAGRDAAGYGDRIPDVLSVLNQSPHLFDTTVANNIRLGRPLATDAEIAAAGEQARLGELIASLPQGYDTPVREAGQRFSGGERQRIALARILLQNTPVILLDEPTVGLDPRTERELLATLFTATAGKTVIWVTHHLVGVENMDEVLFVENGTLVMRGTHAELLEREPRYRRLYELDCPERFIPEQA
ncbi:amino acid ABC transporter ATP-binding/permease protein [Paenibacillus glufosinatiresistens]|uniref:amino acid ABC transporter ATP-binding/permease protein n=1 Tax=Paenibacillus glufosinatiresistens TaxID=3070657 RepID=UPI00286D9945|nr:amino acid ABC transporter ATP-binding/permease protein [Paenibacillus sp. YX.27]